MKLSKYLRPGSIIIGLSAQTKWEAIDELLAPLDRQGLVADAAKVREDLIARERKMSTGMERGLAIPHAKSSGAKELAVALGITPEGIEFDSLDGQPATMIFLVVSRHDRSGPHIQCLAEIAALYGRAEVRNALGAAKAPLAAMSILTAARANA